MGLMQTYASASAVGILRDCRCSSRFHGLWSGLDGLLFRWDLLFLALLVFVLLLVFILLLVIFIVFLILLVLLLVFIILLVFVILPLAVQVLFPSHDLRI
jgi:hypothetical protein